MIVVQEEIGTGEVKGQGDVVYEVYDNLETALSVLANDGRPYYGWASAVLNDNGTAQYIVLKSDTPVGIETDDGSTPSGSRGLKILSLDFTPSGTAGTPGTFVATVGVTEASGIPSGTWTMSVTQDGFEVASRTVPFSGRPYGAAFSTETLTSSVISAKGTYTVTLTITAGGQTYTGTGTFTL